MIKRFTVCLLLLAVAVSAQGQSLLFFGTGSGDADRVKIPIDPHTPADIGETDFTIEFWIKPTAGNSAGAINAGYNYDWINGNIILDRDRYSQGRAFGISLTGGAITFGVKNGSDVSRTWRGTTDLRVPADTWRHIAITRGLDGRAQIYVDGRPEVTDTEGPSGNLDYPNGATPRPSCPPPNESCRNSDPFLVIGAEKHDVDAELYPAFRGYLTELRLSTSLRYTGASFAVPTAPFASGAQTAALYHFDHGTAGTDCTTNTVIVDSMGASNGICKFGGAGGPQDPEGPRWSSDSPFTPNPGTLQFAGAPYSIAESGGAAQISVSRTGGTSGAASIDVAHSGGTATLGADFTLPASTTLSWNNGEGGAKSLNVTIVDDASPESNETVVLALANATGATTGTPAQATLTLSDNDGGAGQVVQFSAAAASIGEAAGSIQLTVARTGGTNGSVTVSYATSNGTAASGSDYVAANGTLTLADGQASNTIPVAINNDAAVESDETFTVTLSSPSGATLGANAAATVTISNDDAPSSGGGGGSSGGGGGGGSFGALVMALGLLLIARGRRENRSGRAVSMRVD